MIVMIMRRESERWSESLDEDGALEIKCVEGRSVMMMIMINNEQDHDSASDNDQESERWGESLRNRH